MEEPTDLAKIIKSAGGAAAIRASSSDAPTEWAIYKWAQNGIPHRYWDLVMGLAKADVEKMHAAHQKIAPRKHRSSTKKKRVTGAAA